MTNPPFRFQTPRRLQAFRLTFTSLLTFIFILTITGQGETANLLVEPQAEPSIATQAPVGISDWPTANYNAQRTNYNILESALKAPFDEVPSTIIYDAAGLELKVPFSVIANDQLFWGPQRLSQENGAKITSTDLNGDELWRIPKPADAFWTSSYDPTVVGATVYSIEYYLQNETFSDEQYVIARNIATGAEKWRHPVRATSTNSNQTNGAAVFDENAAYVNWKDDNGEYISKLNATNGNTLWKISPDNIGSKTADHMAIVDPNTGENILVVVHFTKLVGYSTNTGAELWEYDLTAGFNSLYGTEDLLVHGTNSYTVHDGAVIAVDTKSGAKAWETRFPENNCEGGGDYGMATDGSRLFVSGVCSDRLVAYNLNSGVEIWNNEVFRSLGLNREIAVANGFVYAEGFSDSEGVKLHAFTVSGAPVQTINLGTALSASIGKELGQFIGINSISVANGQLYLSWYDVNGHGHLSVWGEGAGTGRLYLDQYDEDSSPTTNPTEDAEVPLVKRDGAYGVEISVGAKIGSTPARFVVYNSNGTVYKEITGEPNLFGYGYFIAPLEYTAAGYEYQVILNNGDELPKRKIKFFANPETNLEAIVQTSGLIWQAPPNTITTPSAVLTANLPAGFPSGTTKASLYLQEAGRGMITIDGVRSGNQVKFTINQNNGLNGDFVATAIAQADKNTVYSNDINLKINSTTMPDVRLQATSALIPDTQGRYTSYTYKFTRERPTIDPTNAADVQIASVVPDPSGYQVTLLVRTPPAVLFDPLTQKWEVSLKGIDKAGNGVGFVTEEINATPDGTYLTLFLPQTGDSPIVRIEAYGSTLTGATRSNDGPSLRIPLAPAAGGCGPNSPPPKGANNPKPLALSDVINLNADVGVTGEAVSGIGTSGTAYIQRELITGQTQACAEAGFRAGGGASVGPMAAGGLAINLRGSGHDAPATSGTKFDITAQAGLGVQLSYSAPSNLGKGGYGTIGLSVTAAPAAKVTGGVSAYQCIPAPKDESECCKGKRCGPPNPDAPGNDHPDDTQSVVINRLNGSSSTEENLAYWGLVLRFASHEGLTELRDYALFRLEDEDRIGKIVTYPADTQLTAAQVAVVARQEAERVAQATLLADTWPTIEAQLNLLEATRANVLANGYYEQMSAMLTGYGIPSQLVTPDFSPDALKDSLLVIPTAGLYGLSGNPTFAARLERFVDQGGTLLVMSQPEDDGLDLLPGTWNAVGYQNDLSCWVAAMTPVAQHPMLSSISEKTVKANVDGYMTSWPNTAELLLKRTKNNQGAFVLDKVGDGHMIVTNMYDDWGRTVGQSSGQVRDLFRDVARWALTADDNMTTTDLNQAVSVPLTLTNLSDQATGKVRYTVRDANGIVQNVGPRTTALTLQAGKASTQNVSVTPKAAVYGLWSISYTLLNSADSDISGETFGAYFAVNGQSVRTADFGQAVQTVRVPQTPQTPIETNATVSATAAFDKVAYTTSDTVNVTLNVSVSGASGGNLRINASLGGDTQEKIISASSQAVSFSFPADFSGGGLFYFGIYDDATDQGLYLDTSWAQPAGTAGTLTPDKVRYAPGETVTFNVTGTYSGTMVVSGADFSQRLTVDNDDGSVQLTLPATLASGSYTAKYSENGQIRIAHFDVAGVKITVTKMGINKAVANAAETVNITADIHANKPLNAVIVGRMVDAEGNIVGVFEQDKSLATGEQQVVMPVKVTTSAAGTVRYDISVLDKADTSVIHAKAHRFISLNLPQLLGLNVEGSIVATDQASLMVDFYSPSAQTVTLSVEIDGKSVFSKSVAVPAGFSSQTVPLSGSLAKGGHSAFMRATSGSLSSEKTQSFVVGDALPQPNGAIYLPLIVR